MTGELNPAASLIVVVGNGVGDVVMLVPRIPLRLQHTCIGAVFIFIKQPLMSAGKCWERSVHVRPVVCPSVCLSDASCVSGMLSAGADPCRVSMIVTSISPGIRLHSHWYL